MEQQENTVTEKSVEQLVAEAEERGYKRGRNEQIEAAMQQPAVWESPILQNPPFSIWDE